MSAWVLPDHIADVLPSEARHIEELRRLLLDTARSYGFELVSPPLLEHIESLLTGTGKALDLQTCPLARFSFPASSVIRLMWWNILNSCHSGCNAMRGMWGKRM